MTRSPASPSWSDAELLHEAVVVPRRAFVPMPDTLVVERPGWMQLVTPSLPEAGLNEVSLAVLDDDVADAIVDATIADYRDRGLRFRWTVGPDSRPRDLADRLQRRGFVPHTLVAVARSIDDVAWPCAGVTVEAVIGDDVGEFTEVTAAGWRVDARPLEALHRHFTTHGGGRLPMFVARVGGRAAGSAAYLAAERSAYLMGGVVLPEFRGRGVYRALVAARLEHARRRGLALATSQAREQTAYPILAGLGFRPVCRMVALTPPA